MRRMRRRRRRLRRIIVKIRSKSWVGKSKNVKSVAWCCVSSSFDFKN